MQMMMQSVWLKVIMAAVLSLLMSIALFSCGDGEKTTEAPTDAPTEAPIVENNKGTEDEEEEFVLNGSDGLSYAANSAGTTCYMNGLGSFKGTKLRIPDVVLGVNDRRQTVIGIQAGALDGEAAAALEEIDIPSTVKKLPEGLFDQCENLKLVRYFGSELLWNTMIETDSVTVPKNVTVLFCKYYDLTVQYLYMDGTEAQKEKVTSYINDTAFTVTVPKKAGYRADADVMSGVITEDVTVTITYTKIVASGSCGENLTWTYYEDNRLDISGDGLMYDYIDTAVPWSTYLPMISEIMIGDGVQSIGAYAFAGCTAVEHVLLPAKLQTVGAYAFRDWTSAQTIEFCGGVDILTMMDAVWNSKLDASVCFRYGSYEQDHDLTNGKEPLVWTLVDQDNGAYLLTLQYAIAMKPFHNSPVGTDWEHSDLRAWLSNEFQYEAFTDEERAAQDHAQKGIGMTDEDLKLFIFTASELAMLYPEEEMRIRYATAHANPVEIEVENEDGTVDTVIGASEEGVYWWLRDNSVLGIDLLAQNVSPDGVTNSDGALVSTTNRGVTLSVWVNPSND